MKKRTLASCVLCFVIIGSTLSYGGDDVQEFPFDESKVMSEIDNASTCGSAINSAEVNAQGSSMDVSLVEAAIAACMKTTLKKIEKTENAMLNYQYGRCIDKYKKKEGTMYQSRAAFCKLKQVAALNAVYLKVE